VSFVIVDEKMNAEIVRFTNGNCRIGRGNESLRGDDVREDRAATDPASLDERRGGAQLSGRESGVVTTRSAANYDNAMGNGGSVSHTLIVPPLLRFAARN
jgi:hypothetical protein